MFCVVVRRLIRQALPTLFSDVRSCDSHVDSHVKITEDTDLMTDSSQHCVNSDLTQDYTNYCSDHCTENMEGRDIDSSPLFITPVCLHLLEMKD